MGQGFGEGSNGQFLLSHAVTVHSSYVKAVLC